VWLFFPFRGSYGHPKNILPTDRWLHRLAGPRFSFIKADICDAAALRDTFARAWGLIASCTARREQGDPQAASARHKAPAPECPGARRKPALDGRARVRYMFHVALDGALRLDIVDTYRRFRLVSLARKSIAGRVSRNPPSPELPSTELPSPKLRAAHGFCARLRLNARAWFSAGDREST
jgi:hypothetical protein